MKHKLPYYGVHTIDNIEYLVQSGRDIQNAIGLQRNPNIKAEVYTKCPHGVTLEQPDPMEGFMEALSPYIDDALIDYLAPIPRVDDRVCFLDQTHESYHLAYYMAQMSSPVINPVISARFLDLKKFSQDLNKSNIMSYIITDIDSSEFIATISNLAHYSKSKVLMMGSPMTPITVGVERIFTQIELTEILKSEENWRRLGAKLLRSTML